MAPSRRAIDDSVMETSRLSTQLHRHFAGLVAVSELSESELGQLARQLASAAPDETSVRRALQASEVCRWRLAAGVDIWDGEVPSTDFLGRHEDCLVDAWQEEDPLISEALIQEILRAV